ncbi:hypothetical protein [Nitrosomonas eutropha]|uniref:hypothetical protein n=1 Tax=Nitrosomonas eutropha TaxID=916 RepID=UPI00140FD065|nr:hypothetical protein [Nitrosomonas eutropha]
MRMIRWSAPGLSSAQSGDRALLNPLEVTIQPGARSAVAQLKTALCVKPEL